MNRKIEDRMIELAFGELSPEETRRLEAKAISDPAAAHTLREYRNMRENLRSMAEVPEHQLSNERLRDAILARGLSQQASKPAASSSRGWIWMPVTAYAVAFALVLWKNGSQPTVSGEPLVMMPSASQVAVNKDWNPHFEDYVRPFDFSQAAAETTAVTKKPSPTTKTSGTKHVLRHNAKRWNGSQIDRERSKGSLVRNRNEPVFIKAPPVVPDEDSFDGRTAMMSDEQPIVLIAAEKDLTTGAQVATEVQSANVLVGG